MSKLIIVSNRVAIPGGKTEAGGLAVALTSALKERGGIWFGWSGKTSESESADTREQDSGDIRYVTIDLNAREHEFYYRGFCNSVLWPLFHYRLDLSHFSPEMYDDYQSVNHRFAEEVHKVAEADDVIWAHDYHLLSFAAHLRELGNRRRVGFFLHIPFPVPEVFCALPFYPEILKALCAYDVLGFQTDMDLQAFLRCITELGGGHKSKSPQENMYDITAFGMNFRAGRFSISIDTGDLMLAADRSEIDPKTVKLRQSLRSRYMLIGVDRLDYTKGLMQRLEAYQHFLHQWPEYNNKVTYVQITPPSRTDVEEYGKMREDLEGMAAHINGENSDIDWVPIRYLNKSFTRDELAGFYRTARVGLVTPLRDGMNLVAKEYVASQDSTDPGVLLLSKFAGAADEMKCGALLINPYNAAETAKYIREALEMPLQERQERYEAMISVIKRNDIFLWMQRFLSQLTNADNPPIIFWKQDYIARVTSAPPSATVI